MLTEYESPYKEYLNGENNGFLIRFSIQGGTLQGDTIIKKFPEDYEYIPPVKDPNPVGSGGNENNVGNNNQVTDGKRPETDGLSIEASKMIEMQTSNLEQDVNHSKTKSQERNTKKAVGAGDKAINSGDNLLEEVILLPEEVSLSDKVEVDKEQALLENQNLQSTLRDNDEKNLKGIKS